VSLITKLGPGWGGCRHEFRPHLVVTTPGGGAGVSSRMLAQPVVAIFASCPSAWKSHLARSRGKLFEQIRRDRRIEGLSIRELAERQRVHRRTVWPTSSKTGTESYRLRTSKTATDANEAPQLPPVNGC
jgi:hypothetical protein